MTYEQFLEKIKEAGISYETPRVRDSYGNYIKPATYGPEQISCKWVNGGVEGGNCWGGRASRPVSSEPEPELYELDQILEVFCPNITFLQYKTLCNQLVQYDNTEDYGYYGNSTTYGIKKVILKELYDYLVEKGLIN